MAITKITDHVLAAQNRLIQQYKDSTNIKSLIADLFGTQVQELEDVYWDLLSRLDINTMVGLQLDNIGTIVGQPRNGQSDFVYRLFIQAKIGVNVSESEADRIIDVWQLISQASVVHLFEVYPAEVNIYYKTSFSPSQALLDLAFQLIQDVAGAGIAVGFIARINNINDFGFEGSANSLGFGTFIAQGINTSVVANRLVDSGATFQTDGVATGMIVNNTDDDTEAFVISVPNETQIILGADIFTATPKSYYINENTGGTFSFIDSAL